MPTMNKMQLWLRDYEARRHSKQPKELKESWQSSKYDFSDPDVRLEYVPEMGCSVGGCISALKKLWKSYKIAGRNGEPRSWQAYSINKIQGALGLELSSFPETEGMTNDFEDQTDEEEQELRREEESESGEWDLNSGTSEVTDDWSALDKRLLWEEKAEEDW